MNELKVMIITQKIDKNDDILGFFYRWLEILAKKIDKIYVLALKNTDIDLPTNIKLYSVGEGTGNSRIRRFLKFNQIAARLLLSRKVNIVFVHMCPEYALSIFPYAKIARIPMVMWYAHGYTGLKLRIAQLLVNKVITSSKESFRIKSNKVIISGQGIDVDKFNPTQEKARFPDINTEKKTILSVGRISPIKNYEVLIRTADILVNQKNIRDLKFQIVGGVSMKSQNGYLYFLKNIVSKYELEDYVQFVGPIPYTQIHNYYQNCDLFVSTSNTGSLDKTVLEAMACGKVVLTCNEAFKDILGNYSNKLMFRKGDSTELVEKISFLLQIDKKLLNELEINLRNITIQKHSLDKLIYKLRSIFHDLIQRRENHR